MIREILDPRVSRSAAQVSEIKSGHNSPADSLGLVQLDKSQRFVPEHIGLWFDRYHLPDSDQVVARESDVGEIMDLLPNGSIMYMNEFGDIRPTDSIGGDQRFSEFSMSSQIGLKMGQTEAGTIFFAVRPKARLTNGRMIKRWRDYPDFHRTEIDDIEEALGAYFDAMRDGFGEFSRIISAGLGRPALAAYTSEEGCTAHNKATWALGSNVIFEPGEPVDSVPPLPQGFILITGRSTQRFIQFRMSQEARVVGPVKFLGDSSVDKDRVLRSALVSATDGDERRLEQVYRGMEHLPDRTGNNDPISEVRRDFGTLSNA